MNLIHVLIFWPAYAIPVQTRSNKVFQNCSTKCRPTTNLLFNINQRESENGTHRKETRKRGLNYRFIHTVLTQAEKEMICPKNAASKAELPKKQKSKVDTYQTDELIQIRAQLRRNPSNGELRFIC